MSTFEITQSLNWYKSNIMTMDKCGNLLAYGSRTIIVLVKGLEGKSVYDLQYNRLRVNTKLACGRIGAVSFSNKTDTHEDAYYLASIDEVNIYIWKIGSMTCEHIHSFGNKKNKNISLLDIAWLYGCLTVVAISDAGTLHKWDIQALTMRNFTLDIKISPLTIAACPHKRNIIAIGCKNGNIVVYDLTGDGRVLHKLHYHERNIVSLAWCPVPYSPLSSDQSTEPLLLASTACDKSGLYICRAGTDMYSEATVTLPMRPLRKTIYKNKTNLVWSCIKWVKPTMIIVTSSFGEIFKVDLQPKNKSPIVTLISDKHKDVIFSIACSPEAAKPYLWSSCMSRKLIRTPLFDTTETGESLLEVPTLGSFVYCFSLSPVNSADFAFGLGDGRIHYWNVSNKRQLELITLSYSVDSKVLSLAFHPQDEGLLAFGTGDGRVGIVNLTKKRNNVSLLKTVLSHPIYRLCWAPLPNTKLVDDAKLALYALGNGEIIIYNDMNIWKDPHYLKEYVLFNEIEGKLTTPVKRNEMAWKPDYEIVAIGNSNGSIYLLCGDTLKLQHVVLVHDQTVECIIWHPTHVTCDYSEESKFKNYFASSSHNIRVHKLNEDGSPSLVVEFKGHDEKVNELAWSPHRNLMLLSCSNDFTAKVWDVQKSTLIGVYSKHLCTVLCGMFSPLDSDIVFTGSADNSVHSWRVSKDLHSEKVDLKKNQDTPNIVNEKIIAKSIETTKTENTDSSIDKTIKLQQFPLSSYDLYVGKHLEKSVDKFIDSNFENKTNVNVKENNYLAFFGTTEEIKHLLVDEYHALKKKSKNQKIPLINNVNIWGQNLEGYFKDAIETKTINDWMIAVAPSVSYELWTKMCNAYSCQLEDVGEVTKASTYLVAIKKFREAARMLSNNNLFREALAVIKSQEKQDDEIILEISKKWAEYNVQHGHPKEAAHWLLLLATLKYKLMYPTKKAPYLSIGDTRNAISCLIKVKQVKELSLAAKLASYIDEDLEESLVLNILKMEHFKHHKWNEARELIISHPKLDHLNMWIGVHEAMFELNPTDLTYNIIKNWICSAENEEKCSIIHYILENIECKPNYYDKLMKSVDSEFISDTSLLMPKITIFIAGQFCLMALKYKTTGLITVDSQRCLIKCLAVAYNYEIFCTDSKSKFNILLSRLLIWIFPKGPLANDLFANFEINDDLLKTIRAYLCYTCFSWLKPLYESLNKKINLSLEKNNIVEKIIENRTFDEINTLTRQFQLIFSTYIHDIMDLEATDYYKAKIEIERINRLLTTGSSTDNIHGTVNNVLNEHVKFNNSVDEIDNTMIINGNVELKSEVKNVKCLTEDMKERNISDTIYSEIICECDKQDKLNCCCKSPQSNNTNKNCGIVCTNGILGKLPSCEINLINLPNQNISFSNLKETTESKNCEKEVFQFYQNLKTQLSKFNYVLNDQSSVKHFAHLEIEASKKKELENIVTEFENKRISSPNPFLFGEELKTFICDSKLNFP